MHEYGLFKLLLPQLEPYINAGAKVKLIRLKIGELKGIVDEHLAHAFEHFKEEYPNFSDCKLEWEISRVRFRCRKCGKEFDISSPTCPYCGEQFPELASGDEFELTEIQFF